MLFIYRRPAAFGLFALSEVLGTGTFTELRHGGGPVGFNVHRRVLYLAGDGSLLHEDHRAPR